jgi:DinB superfamily
MRLLFAGTEFDRRAPAVSGWSVGQQVAHLAKADLRILGDIMVTLDGGEAGRPTHRRMTLTGRVLVGLGWLPRGIAKAPESARPEAGIRPETVRTMLCEVEALLARAEGERDKLLESRVRIRHPYFGGLTPAQWLRFIPVHHHHHLKIVRDILAIAD